MKTLKIKKASVILLAACMILAGCARASTEPEGVGNVTIRIGALKGPTSMGLLFMMNEGNAENGGINYDFKMAASADEILPLMVKGDLDIALLPANVASILYAKTEGAVSILDINTLGVLYMVSGSGCERVEELKGRTVYLTGKGTTPDYVLQYVLEQNGVNVDECSLEYKSEATEVAAFLADNPDAIGLLPQPFVTAACAQNDKLKIVMDMNEEWNKVQGSGMVTGVTVVRKEFLEEHEQAVLEFLEAHDKSARAVNEDPEQGAVYAAAAGIVNSEAVAKEAIPYCNITCITGDEMKGAVEGYLEVLYNRSPESVGGMLPGEDFYYLMDIEQRL